MDIKSEEFKLMLEAAAEKGAKKALAFLMKKLFMTYMS